MASSGCGAHRSRRSRVRPPPPRGPLRARRGSLGRSGRNRRRRCEACCRRCRRRVRTSSGLLLDWLGGRRLVRVAPRRRSPLRRITRRSAARSARVGRRSRRRLGVRRARRGSAADASAVIPSARSTSPALAISTNTTSCGGEVGPEDPRSSGPFDESTSPSNASELSRSISGAADTSIVTRSAMPRSRACIAVTAWM